jgi:tetratricopeptide (TPR) repeat protein
MPWLTGKRAVWLSAAVAGLLYLPALWNGWALDDNGLIRLNPAAHSIGAALRALFSPYWPPEGDYSPGLYRPLVTLSYGLDWVISGARPAWFHLVNLMLHAAATALVAVVALRWLPPLGVLVAGVLFAVHPVHVEAVANVVGRAEILAALGLLGAVLSARRYRAASSEARPRWLLLTLLATAVGLGSKEHAVVTLGVLAVDHWLEPGARRRPAGGLYLAVTCLTVAWLFVWRAIAAPLAPASAVAMISGLPTGQRLAAVIPVQLDVLRLLVWPWSLSADYAPQLIPIRTSWSVVATVAVMTSLALLGLAAALRHRAPPVALGILVAAATYLPTSNLLFTSGVLLAERSLYLAVLAPALAAGWLIVWADSRRRLKLAATIAGLVGVAFVARSATRVSHWRDGRTVVIEGILEHPENFGAHLRVADALLPLGDSARALAHYLTAIEIYGGYSRVAIRAGRLALAMGRPGQALDLGRRARALAPAHPDPAELLSDVFLVLDQPDSALAVARAALAVSPVTLRALENYRRVLERTQAPGWQRQLAAARVDDGLGRLVAASARLDSVSAAFEQWGTSPGDCWEIERSLPVMQTLKPALAGQAGDHVRAACRESVR